MLLANNQIKTKTKTKTICELKKNVNGHGERSDENSFDKEMWLFL